MMQAEGASRNLEPVDSGDHPNERPKFATDQKITFANAFEIADDVLRQAVQSISDLIKNTGFINLDFADVTRRLRTQAWPTWALARRRQEQGGGCRQMAISSPCWSLHQRRQGRAGQRHRLHGHRSGGSGDRGQPGADRPPTPTRLIIFAPLSTTLWRMRSASPSSPPALEVEGAMPNKPFSAAAEKKAEAQPQAPAAPAAPAEEDPFEDIFQDF